MMFDVVEEIEAWTRQMRNSLNTSQIIEGIKLKNPLSIFNKETSVVKAISKDTNVSVSDVERVLISAKQITENSSLMMLNNQRSIKKIY